MNTKHTWAIAVIFLIACSKSPSSGSSPTPPQPINCSNRADCITGSWFIQSSNARLKNGATVAIYSKSGTNNLLDFENWNWIFSTDGKWTEILHGGILNDSGRYVINKDTLFTKGKFPHTYVISDINKASMSGYFVYDHAKPDTLTVITALAIKIDTANLNNMTAEWVR